MMQPDNITEQRKVTPTEDVAYDAAYHAVTDDEICDYVCCAEPTLGRLRDEELVKNDSILNALWFTPGHLTYEAVKEAIALGRLP